MRHGKRPKHLGRTLRRLLRYLGKHRLALAAVALLVVCSSMANILGTYLLRPVIREFIEPKDLAGLWAGPYWAWGRCTPWGLSAHWATTS